jgi:hypothetical protein
VALIDLFTYPTIRALARHLDDHDRRPAAQSELASDRRERRREYLRRKKQSIHKETVS